MRLVELHWPAQPKTVRDLPIWPKSSLGLSDSAYWVSGAYADPISQLWRFALSWVKDWTSMLSPSKRNFARAKLSNKACPSVLLCPCALQLAWEIHASQKTYLSHMQLAFLILYLEHACKIKQSRAPASRAQFRLALRMHEQEAILYQKTKREERRTGVEERLSGTRSFQKWRHACVSLNLAPNYYRLTQRWRQNVYEVTWDRRWSCLRFTVFKCPSSNEW